ncbi:nuclear hormone receptor HR96 [Culicoides brevitarsis]|uniref:nuclear hormone receptor HR96 n=1 Tax=Culicoides brevitarsis TaxID=469753 RepID=UPI00307C325C
MSESNTDKMADNGDTGSPKSSARQSRGRTCQVCGDKALGYNFNAVTCESCKAFFRRNALTKKEFTCPFNQNCEITVVTRRFCQKCRLTRCFDIGMKKEYIMSETEKVEKRKKIELNRAKRKSGIPNGDDVASTSTGNAIDKKIKREFEYLQTDDESWSNVDDASETPKRGDFILNSPDYSNPSTPSIYVPQFTTLGTEMQVPDTNLLSLTPSEMVEKIISVPEQSSQMINQLMPTQHDAMRVMSTIIQSKTDALRLINHFITTPGDALTIISKLMNSALDALSVFIQFMSSPTDALQIINKIMSSPDEVLQFIQQLMNSPQDALEVMTKFMNDPAEALKMINRMINHDDVPPNDTENTEEERLRKKVEGNLIKSIISTNTIESAPALEPCNAPSTFNPFNSYSHLCYGATAQCAPEVPVGPSQVNFNETIQSPTTTTTNPEENHAEKTKFSVLDEIANKSESKANSIESILCEAIKLEYDCFTLMSQNNTPNRDLNDSERAKLNELIVANKALYAPVDEDWANLINDNARLKSGNPQNPQLLTVINLTAIAIRRLIKMSKKISAFKNMCQEDQVALLKGGCVEMMILRSVMQYDGDRGTWKIPHSQEEMSNIKADVLKLAKGNVYQEHEKFIQTFEKKWRQDENIILIMCAITLFTPDRARTIHSDVIKLEQNSYYYLLRRYLESVYQGCEAKSTFLKLMQKINELHKLNEEIVNVYLDVNPTQVEPLLREIFDLKVNLN